MLKKKLDRYRFLFLLVLPIMLFCMQTPGEALSTKKVEYSIDVQNYPSFRAALSAIGTKKVTLVISNKQAISSNMTISPNIQLEFLEGSSLSIPRDITLTISGTIKAGPYQIISGEGQVIFKGADVKVYPQWWGAKEDGKIDDTKAVQNAINAVANGGDVIFVKGTYLVNSLALDTNVNIIGQGWTSVIKQKSGSTYACSINPGMSGTPNPDDNKHNIKISNVQFRGTVDVDGFAEHVHLLNINAASNVIISKCKFTGWRGDGIYIGSGNIPKIERHNKNISIIENVFDGINKDNRNAISIIDGDGVTIENNSFANSTRPNQPGAIDVEPNVDGFSIIRNIYIINNKFNNIGGTGLSANIAVFMPVRQIILKTPSKNIVIKDNIIDGNGFSNGISLKQLQEASDMTTPNDIIVSNNNVMHTGRPFIFWGVKGIKIKDNVFEDSVYSASISEIDKYKVQDIDFEGNVFKELGSTDGIGITIFSVDRIDFVDNVFDNIGRSNGTYGVAIKFQKGTADWVRLENNTITGERTTGAVEKEAGNITNPKHNDIKENIFHGNKIDLR